MSKKQKLILFALVVIVAGGMALALVYYNNKRLPQGESPLTGEEEASPKEPSFNPLGIPIPDDVTYYTGSIVAINDNAFVIEARAIDNFLTQNVQVTVRVNESTTYVKAAVPQYLEKGADIRELLRAQAVASFSSFALGDTITAYSATNIGGRDTFVAKEIRAVDHGE